MFAEVAKIAANFVLINAELAVMRIYLVVVLLAIDAPPVRTIVIGKGVSDARFQLRGLGKSPRAVELPRIGEPAVVEVFLLLLEVFLAQILVSVAKGIAV